MKYIRTKNGHIYEVKSAYLNYFNCIDKTGLMEGIQFHKSVVIKQADTIEELFDELVVYAEDYDYFNSTKILHRHWVFDDIKEAKEQIKLIGAGIKRIIYGAIWTDKGLIYKAKMKGVLPNGEIDWELL